MSHTGNRHLLCQNISYHQLILSSQKKKTFLRWSAPQLPVQLPNIQQPQQGTTFENHRTRSHSHFSKPSLLSTAPVCHFLLHTRKVQECHTNTKTHLHQIKTLWFSLRLQWGSNEPGFHTIFGSVPQLHHRSGTWESESILRSFIFPQSSTPQVRPMWTCWL